MTGCATEFNLATRRRETIISPPQVCVPGTCVQVEVVSQPAELARGLSGRLGLEDNKGMLFVFSRDGLDRFWMKDMNFALDILWLDKNGRIVNIHKNLPPCTPFACPVYAPDHPARYVLEVNAGFADRHKLKVGTLCKIKGI